jgi:hypothetical protein
VLSRIGDFLTRPLEVSDTDLLMAGSLKRGITRLGDVPSQIQFAELSGLQNAREARYGKNLENAPPEVKKQHAETAAALAQLQKDAAIKSVESRQIDKEFGVNPLADKLSKLAQDEKYKNAGFLDKSKQYGQVLLDNVDELPGYIGTLGLESAPASVAVIATALLTRFLPGGSSRAVAATTAGGTSGFIEFGSNYADMREQGMSHEEAWEKAAVKSGVIGFFDGVAFGSAGKAANEVMKKVEQGAAVAATKQTLKSTTTQGAYGAAGEGVGSATIGEELDPISIGAEALGEFVTGPLDAAASYRNYKESAQQPTTAQPKTREQIQADKTNLDALSAEYQSMMAEAQKYPAGSVENQTLTQQAFDFFDQNIAPIIETPVEIDTTSIATSPQEEMITSTAPGIEVSYPRGEVKSIGTVDPETGEVITTPGIEASYPKDQDAVTKKFDALVTKFQRAGATEAQAFKEAGNILARELDDRTSTGVDTGRVEPSISMPVEGATPAEGVTPSDISGLADTVGDIRESDVRERAERTALDESQIPTLTERADPVTLAEMKLANAELAVTQAATPEAKKVATKERNKARQELKKVQAAPVVEEPIVETPMVEEPVVETPSAPVLSEQDQTRLESAQRDANEAQATLGFLAERGFTTPEQNYGVEAAQNKLAKAQETINQFEPPVETVAPIVQQAQAKLADAEAAVAAATTPEAKKEATAQRNVARQEVKKVEAAAPTAKVITTPTAPKRGRSAKPKVEGAEPKTPKPRGRKKIERTPEEQVVAAEKRKAKQAESIKAGRLVDKLINIITTPFDADKYETDTRARVALAQYGSDRRDAIYSLNKYTEPTSPFRDSENSGIKARNFLSSSDKITQKERADLQTRLEFEKTRPPKPSAARAKTTEKPVKAFYGFTRASQAIDYIVRNGTPFERALAARLKPFVSDVRLTVADTKENTPNEIQDLISDASGVYSSRRYGDKVYRMIVLRGENFDDPDMQGVNNIIFLHEALHAATEAKIDEAQELASLDMPLPAQLQALMNDLLEIRVAAQTRYDQLKASGADISPNLRHKFEKLGIAGNAKEFVAYGMSDPDVQQFLLDTPGYVSKDQAKGYIKNLFNKFVNSMRRAFNIGPKDQSALQDLMLVTEGLLQEQEIEPAFSVNTVLESNREKQTAIANLRKKLASSYSSTENNASLGKLVVKTRSANDALRLLRAAYSAMDVGKMRAILPTLTTDDITRWAGDKVKNLRKVNKAVDSMSGMRNKMTRELAEKIPAWVTFNKKYEEGGKLLGDVMGASTLKNVDPTAYATAAAAILNDPLIKKNTALLKSPQVTQAEARTLKRQQAQRTNEITEVYRLWNELAKYGNREGHRIYTMAKQAYADTFDLHEKLLQKKIDASDAPNDQKQKLLSSITKMFQEAKRLGVYFPLMRYGNFWFSVGKGASGEYYMFESATARNNFVDKRVAELQAEGDKRSKAELIADRDIDVGDQLRDQRESVVESSKMLKDVFALLENGNLKDVESVKDQVYQMYLMTLPDRDMRKKFTHRQGKTGFSADVIRNFVTSQHTAANQLARLAYADDIRNGLAQAYAELAGNPDKLKLATFVDEIALRSGAEITPKVVDGIDWNKYASIGNQVVFFYMLTSPKSALVQMTQMPIVVLPAQIAKYGSSVPKVVARYSNIFRMLGLSKKDSQGNVITKWGQPSINDSMYIRNIKDPTYKAALTEAWNAANDRDIFMSTYASDMSARSNAPTGEYQGPTSRAFRTVGNFMSGAFHHMERMTREITYMSTFELEYAKARKEGLSSKEATARGIEAGVNMTYDSLFNYSDYNKPRAMKTPLTRVAFQFMMFPLQMTSFLVRNFYGMLPVLNKQDKREAAIKFFGALGMTTLFAGVTGLPGYSMIMGLAEGIREMLRDEDDEDYDEDDEGNPLGKRSLDLWFRNWFLPTYLGEDSSIAAALNLTPEQADLLVRSAKLGPISALTDMNLGSSISLDGLWFRNDISAKTSKDAFEQLMFDYALGAFGSMGSQVASAYDEFNNGQFNRGVEKLLPAFARGIATAVRLGTEGAKSRDGAEIMNAEFYTTGKLLAQSLGAGSTEVADIQKQNFIAKQMLNKINAERQNILTNLDAAFQRFDNNPNNATEAALEKVFERIEKYNAKNGMLPISGETISKSMAARQRSRAGAFQGVTVPQNAAPYIYPLLERGRSREYK